MPRRMRYGFTLVELLVVIAIIAILLALLAPAMDKAIYQTELTVCAANMRGIGSAVFQYAAANKRNYPGRTFVRGKVAGATPNNVSYVTSPYGTSYGYDDRPMLRELLGPINKMLYCPLGVPADIEGARDESIVYGGCDLWFGWQFLNETGMFRLGDRFTTGGSRFAVLASDNERHSDTNGASIMAHPDHDGLLAPRLYQDENAYSGGAFMGFNVGAIPVTDGRWQGSNNRGPVDRNLLLDDGGVRILDRLKVGNKYDGREPRMTPVPDTLDPSQQAAITDNLPSE